MVTLAADILIEQRGGTRGNWRNSAMAPRTHWRRGMTKPAQFLRRRHRPGQTTPLGAAGNGFYAVRARARIDKSPAPLVLFRMLDTLAYAA